MKNNTHHTRLGLIAALATAAFLQGCAGGAPNASSATSSATPSATEVTFPDVAQQAWLKEGTFPNLDNLRQMRTGMSKDQIYDALGRPHFDEGMFGVRQWNYLFNFRTGPGPEYVSCQYQVRFDDKLLSESLHWKEPQCAQYLRTAAAAPAPAPVVAVAPAPAPAPVVAAVAAPQVIELSADALFRFDGGARDDLLPEGKRALSALATQLQRDFAQLQQVTVTGHADRLGDDAYNERLSLQRANTVRDMLAQAGLKAGTVRTVGAGKREPVKTDCVGAQSTPELKACLQPNRRVTVAVSGIRR